MVWISFLIYKKVKFQINKKMQVKRKIYKSFQYEKMRHSLRARLFFLLVAIVILAIEIFIAVFVKGGFVRHYLGDVLVTVMLYAFGRAVFKIAPKILAFEIFIFSLFIEILQYFKMLEILDIHNLIIRIVFGGTFDVSDIVCYALGCLLAYLTDIICLLQKYKSPKI